MPQLRAYLLAHLDTVAGIEKTAQRRIVDDVQVLLHHILVVFESAGRHNHTVQGTDIDFSTVPADLDTDDDLGVWILNQLQSRRCVPYINLVGVFRYELLDILEEEAVAHS